MSAQKDNVASKPFAQSDGRFRRQESSFRDRIEKGGKFEPEVGRYKLIVSLACPWAHRALIVRALKRMDEVPDLLPVTIVDTFLGEKGWCLGDAQTEREHVPASGPKIPGFENARYLRELYLAANPDYDKRPTVPVVWDAKNNTIVNNESSEVIRFLDSAFDEFLPEEVRGITYYPEELRSEIDAFHEWVYPNINNGVYKTGFATNQEAYVESLKPLFEALHRVDRLLKGKQYAIGDRLTEADIRLFTTIVRFDPVYYFHFKCNLDSIRGGAFPNLHRWMRELYWKNAAFKDTTDFKSIKDHYFASHVSINPTGVVPLGPEPPILPLDN
ncbi:glutathionyl-hydroquinone reductase [Malassezia japonica]|uniref:Glutathionyl-hydroquinone reductase n=1 Tax=Malassezia japonica TaxID=223818 RepID=A0AAF0F6S3_9BASI|nr:glutathionyl-hydroquinone reductase [Malassezia japonica]WFD39473.1 glutathionyl-hydroquinone reductase [Malassezia japonica]